MLNEIVDRTVRGVLMCSIMYFFNWDQGSVRRDESSWDGPRPSSSSGRDGTRTRLISNFWDEDRTRTGLERDKDDLNSLVLSLSQKFEIYLVLVLSRPEDDLGRGPSQDDSSRPTDP